MGGVFDFSKSLIPIESPSKPGRGVVGLNIDRCIIRTEVIGNASFATIKKSHF